VRGHALVDVVAPLERVTKLIGERAGGREAGISTGVHDALGSARGDRTARADVGGQGVGLRPQTIGGVHGEDEPEALHLRRVDLTPGADELESSASPHDGRKPHRPARSGEAAPQRLGKPEGRVGGGQPHVAGQGQLRRSRACRAVECRDDDLGKRLDGIVEPIGNPDQIEDLLLGVAGPHGRIQDAHREELRAAARDDHGLDLVVAGKAVGDALHGQENLAGQSILVTGAIEGEGEDALIALHSHIGH
jgi:hypothetical protein